jgi:hypothetical protein
MKTRIKTLWAVLVLAAVATVQAIDVPFSWELGEAPETADGSTLFVVNRQTGVTNTFDVVGPYVTNIVVNIETKTANDVWVCAWAETVNPDGSRPRIYSERSNVLDVKVAGRRGNVIVK